MALIKCSECGKEFSEYAKACPNCGCPADITLRKIRDTKPVIPEERPDFPYTEKPLKESQESSKKIRWLLVGCIIALILSAILGIAYFSGAFKEKQAVTYIGSRTVDYDAANAQHRVFWDFQDQNNQSMTADADIHIVITNKKGEVVYDKVTSVDESYYTTWTNKFKDEAYLAGCIYIPDSELKKGSSTEGTLTISAYVAANDISFDEHTINVMNLPVKDFRFSLKDPLPQSINYYDFRGSVKTTVSLTDVSWDWVYYDYNDSVTLTLHLRTTMDYNRDGAGTADYSYVSYSIYDSSGMIVDAGDHIIEKSKVGDTIVTDQIVFDLSLDDSYTIEFADKH
ncbi:MAG: zinc ribbon domain-containing protein [Solobacterium sp.]|nr:zinc ribbon domain-containing protein [Solobacterium sp.]